MSIDRMPDAGRVPTVADPHLQRLLDKQACAEVLMTYCRAVDRRDESLLRSVFHPDAWHRHGFEGPSNDPARPSAPGRPGDFVAFVLGYLAGFACTHHQLGNVFVELEDDGSTAYAEAYFTAYLGAPAAQSSTAEGPSSAGPMDVWVGGRYLDRLDKRESVWKIAYRVGIVEWSSAQPPGPSPALAAPPELRARPDRDDLLYRRRSAFVRPRLES
jgi:hypothetical protein